MKAVISNKIFIEATPQEALNIKRALTYKIPVYGDGPPLIINNFTIFKKKVLCFPVGRLDLIPNHHEIIDKRIHVPVDFPEFKYELRESQKEVVSQMTDNCMLNAKVGYGKTFTALKAAQELGQKTLIIVHTLALLHQWKKEVEKVFGFTPSLIGGGHDSSDQIITIGNVASVTKRMHLLGKLFGTLIIDECHHVPANTFKNVVDKCYARFKIGLSGTLIRKDQLHVLLKDYFGDKVIIPPRENTLIPTIHAYNTGFRIPYGSCWADQVTNLLNDPQYQFWILDKIAKYASEGHQILLVADRLDFLKRITSICNSALIVGETKDRDAEFLKLERGETKLLSGIVSIFKEGISHNPLSCLILGTPINNESMLEQLIGRIQRMHPGKPNPVVVDPIFNTPTGKNQFLTRTGVYLREGFPVVHY